VYPFRLLGHGTLVMREPDKLLRSGYRQTELRTFSQALAHSRQSSRATFTQTPQELKKALTFDRRDDACEKCGINSHRDNDGSGQ